MPSYTLTTSLASAVPVRVTVLSVPDVAVRMTGTSGTSLSIVMLTAVEGALETPVLSIAVAVKTWVPLASC